MCEVRSKEKRPKTKNKNRVISSKKKWTLMNLICRRMKKRSPSSGQNGQLVHWWLLVHSGPGNMHFPCDTEGLPLLQQHIPCHICVRLPLLLFSCLCMKNSSLGTSFPTSLIQQVRYANHDLPTVWRIKVTRLAFRLPPKSEPGRSIYGN
jgi:hypothetical protein